MFRAAALALLLPLACLATEAASPVTLAVAPDPDAADKTLQEALASARHLTIQLPGMSHHFSRPTDKDGNVLTGRKFNEQNWGIGIQLESALSGEWEGWVTKTSFGVLKDSLDAMGLYAGHTVQKRWLDNPVYSVDAGAGAFLFYRTLQFDGPHRLIPAVLPVLSAQHKATRLGLNVVAVPPFKVHSGKMPGVLYVQFTKAF